MATTLRSAHALRFCAQSKRAFSGAATDHNASTTSAIFNDLSRVASKPRTTPARPAVRRENESMQPFLDKMNRKPQHSRGGRRDPKQEAEVQRLVDISRTRRRLWKGGDVYAPHDLSAIENSKWGKPTMQSTDVFDELALNPLDEWKNPSLMYNFTSSVGRIKNRTRTSLRPVNQRRVARAVRRAVGMGFLPSAHPHPEILRRAGMNWERLR